jgi:hypothetical protein
MPPSSWVRQGLILSLFNFLGKLIQCVMRRLLRFASSCFAT